MKIQASVEQHGRGVVKGAIDARHDDVVIAGFDNGHDRVVHLLFEEVQPNGEHGLARHNQSLGLVDDNGGMGSAVGDANDLAGEIRVRRVARGVRHANLSMYKPARKDVSSHEQYQQSECSR